MADEVTDNLAAMDTLDFEGWNAEDWELFSHFHSDDVHVNFSGSITDGLAAHLDSVKQNPGVKIVSHPIAFGSGAWTCVVGEIEGGGRMVTVARWEGGAIVEENIWM